MKKLFTFICTALLSAGVWADTAVLSKSLGANGAEAADANSITGAAGSAAEGWTIAMTGNTEKSWSHGSKPIKYNGVDYVSLKNSNNVQITVTAPAGNYVSKVEFYAVSNDPDVDAVLKEFDGSTCSDAVTSHKDFNNPTYIAKELATPKNEFTFNFGSKQVCFIAVVTYSGNTNPNCAEPQIAFGDWNDTENGFPVTITTNEAGVSLSYAVNEADYVAYEGVFYVGSKAVVAAKASKDGYNDAIVRATAPLHSMVVKLLTNELGFEVGDTVCEGMRFEAPDITLVLHDTEWQNNAVAKIDSGAPAEFGYTTYIAGQTNPSPKDGAIPTAGCFYTFETKADGVLKVAAKINAGKNLYVATPDEQLSVKVNGEQVAYGGTLAAATYGMIEFAVKKDATYYVWCTGSKLILFGFVLGEKEESAVESIQQSAVSTTKVIRNGQVVILRNGVEYTLLGTQY